jgi:hypothetical protein
MRIYFKVTAVIARVAVCLQGLQIRRAPPKWASGGRGRAGAWFVILVHAFHDVLLVHLVRAIHPVIPIQKVVRRLPFFGRGRAGSWEYEGVPCFLKLFLQIINLLLKILKVCVLSFGLGGKRAP